MKKMHDMEKRKSVNAVVYARYSSHNQTEQSIEGQIAAAESYANTRGYNIIHVYADRAMTGRNDNREEFQKMLSDCAKKQFSVIIVWKVDRFGRNRQEITFNKYRAKKHGVRVEYVAENLPDTPEGVILESVLEGMAEYYSLQLSQNVQRGLLESAKKHHAIGGHLPLGYQISKEKEYEIDPKTAPIVKEIFDRYTSGETMIEIAESLNARGYRNQSGAPFGKSSIPSILKNERYVGVYIFKDIIRDENAIPAIIDREIFDKAQMMMKVNRKKPSRKWSYTDYLLTDRLYCGHCGSPMLGVSGIGKMGVKYNYYVCSSHRKDPASCDKKNVRQDYIEPLILDHVKELLKDDELLGFLADKVFELYQEENGINEKQAALQKSLIDAQSGISRLVKSIEAGIPPETVAPRIEALTAQKKAIEKALAENELEKGFTLTRDHILFFLLRFREYDLTDRNAQRRLVETFVNAIYLYDDHFDIAYNYTNANGKPEKATINDIKNAATVFDCDGITRVLPSAYELRIIRSAIVFCKLPLS